MKTETTYRAELTENQIAFLRRWCDAMESGDYTRGTRYFKRAAGSGYLHCALGVLCEVARLPWIYMGDYYQVVLQNFSENNVPCINPCGTISYSISRWSSALPYDYCRFFGINEVNAVIARTTEWGSIDRMNDDGMSFSYMAKVVRNILDNAEVIDDV